MGGGGGWVGGESMVGGARTLTQLSRLLRSQLESKQCQVASLPQTYDHGRESVVEGKKTHVIKIFCSKRKTHRTKRRSEPRLDDTLVSLSLILSYQKEYYTDTLVSCSLIRSYHT